MWLANSRGTKFSVHGETRALTSREYWNFDWEEMGQKDLPAFIDKVLDVNKLYNQVNMLGYSQGNT